MKNELTYEELKKENEEIKSLLSKVLKAYDLMSKELEQYKVNLSNDNSNSTVSSIGDVKKLLDKYSRL